MLKDYVNGKLLYAHPPPGVSPDDYNAENRDLQRLEVMQRLRARKAPVTRVRKNADTYMGPLTTNGGPQRKQQSRKAEALDSSFFHSPMVGGVAHVSGPTKGISAQGFSRSQVPYIRAVNDDGTVSRTSAGNSPLMMGGANDSKKHFKGKRTKQRSGRGYD